MVVMLVDIRHPFADMPLDRLYVVPEGVRPKLVRVVSRASSPCFRMSTSHLSFCEALEVLTSRAIGQVSAVAEDVVVEAIEDEFLADLFASQDASVADESGEAEVPEILFFDTEARGAMALGDLATPTGLQVERRFRLRIDWKRKASSAADGPDAADAAGEGPDAAGEGPAEACPKAEPSAKTPKKVRVAIDSMGIDCGYILDLVIG